MGRIGAVIEPVVKPLGFDGRIGTAILTSFAAREVFNSSLAVIFRVEEADDEEETRSMLRDRIAAATWPDGRPLFTPLVADFAAGVFHLRPAMPADLRGGRPGSRVRGNGRVGQFVFMTGFAYVASLLVFQGGKLLGF